MANRKPLISGNWKMNLTHLDAIAMVQKLAYTLLPADTTASTCQCTRHSRPCVRSRHCSTLTKSLSALGAQNVYPADSGAFTGEVSPVMLAKLNVRYVIVGHSERRAAFWRDRRVRQRETAGGAAAQDGTYPLRRRDAC